MLKWPDNPMKPKSVQRKEGKIVDWLREQRTKKHNETLQGETTTATISNQSYDWSRELSKKQLKGRDRYEMYLGKAKEFEEKAQMKERFVMAHKNQSSV